MIAMAVRRRPVQPNGFFGQQHLARQLCRLMAPGNAHNVIFAGPSGTGKTTAALMVAAGSLCLPEEGRPCLQCRSCVDVKRGINAAHHFVDCAHQGGKEDIDYLLQQETGRAPVDAPCHQIILDEADLLSRSAQSSLLVPTQDTAGYRRFLLTCTDPEALSRPLRDRCRIVRLDDPNQSEAVQFLEETTREENIAIEYGAIDLLAAACRGYRNLLETLEAAADLANGAPIDADLLRTKVLRDRSTVLLEYLSELASGDVERQRELLDQCSLSAIEKVRGLRDILAHLRVHHTGPRLSR